MLLLVVVGLRSLIPGEDGGAGRRDAGPTTRLADDFSSRSGWATFGGRGAELVYADGGYRLRLERPGDDGLSVLVLPGGGWPAVAASTVVEERGPFGGLAGVGCAAARDVPDVWLITITVSDES